MNYEMTDETSLPRARDKSTLQAAQNKSSECASSLENTLLVMKRQINETTWQVAQTRHGGW
jgi:hypothetical protein